MRYAPSIRSEVHNRPRIDAIEPGRHRSTPARGRVRQIPRLSGHDRYGVDERVLVSEYAKSAALPGGQLMIRVCRC